MTRESAATLATRRLRAAADTAYASTVYGAALDDARFRRAPPSLDTAVQAARAYVDQTQLVYENARTDHQRALDAALDCRDAPVAHRIGLQAESSTMAVVAQRQQHTGLVVRPASV